MCTLITLFPACLCEGAVLSHSGRERDAKCSLWISRGQPHRTAGGETPSPRETDQPGCQVSAEDVKYDPKHEQTVTITRWAQPLCSQVWTWHPPASQTGVHEDGQCHRSWVSAPTPTPTPAPATSDTWPHYLFLMHIHKCQNGKILSLGTWRSKAKLLTCRRENWSQRESTRESPYLERRNVGWVWVTADLQGESENKAFLRTSCVLFLTPPLFFFLS